MKKAVVSSLLFYMAVARVIPGPAALCPMHIETPDYPPLARTAHITGKITLAITVDADGRVANVEAMADTPMQREHPILQKYAAENMRHWTFARPPSVPYPLVFVYDYEIDTALPPSGGPSGRPSITKVTFDLPDRVEILTNAGIIDTNNSRQHD